MSERQLLDQLGRHLWEERHVVTYLLFKLTVTKLMLAADDARFLPDVLDEVDQTVAELRGYEAARDESLRALASAWGLQPEELTLAALAKRSPDPYGQMFADHAGAFAELANGIEEVGRHNRALAREQLVDVASALEQITGTPPPDTPTYDASGSVYDGPVRTPTRLREVL